MADITIVNGVYKPTYNWGAPSCTLDVASRCARVARRCADCASATPRSGRRWGLKKGEICLGKCWKNEDSMGFDERYETFFEIFFGNWPQKSPRTYQKQVFSIVLPPVSGVTSFQIYCFLYADLSPGLRAGASLRKAAAAKPYGARCSSGSLGPQVPILESHPMIWIWIQSMASFQVLFVDAIEWH